MLKALLRFIFGPEIRVIDGDTLVIDGIKIRLAGIDAPEISQPGGKESGYYLEYLIKNGGRITYKIKSQDRYGRIVADVYGQDGAESINRLMVLEGWAYHYKEYPNGYAKDEMHAKINKKGLWSDKYKNSIRPSEWRKNK